MKLSEYYHQQKKQILIYNELETAISRAKFSKEKPKLGSSVFHLYREALKFN